MKTQHLFTFGLLGLMTLATFGQSNPYTEMAYASSKEIVLPQSNSNTSNSLAIRAANERAFAVSESLILSELEKADRKGKSEFAGISTNRGLAHAYYRNAKYAQAADYYANYLAESKNTGLSTQEAFEYAHSLKSIGKLKESESYMTMFYILKGDINKAPKASTYLATIDEINDDLILKELSANSNGILYPTGIDPNTKELLVTMANGDNKTGTQENLFSEILTLNPSTQKMSDVKTNFKPMYNRADAVITKDGRTMYYSRNEILSRRELRRGKKINNYVIYIAQLEDGEWIEKGPVSFNFNDASNGHAVLSPDEDYIYFTSDTKDMGMGMSDIYKVRRYGVNSFGTPENLGGAVNSNSDDFSILIDATTQKAYFGSNRAGTDMIYTFNLNDLDVVVQPNPSIPNSKPEVISEEEFSSSNLTLKEIIPYHEQSSSIENKVLFGYDSFELSEANKAYLDALAKLLNKNENLYLEIRAYTDSRGTKEYNLNLSELRAYAVKSYMIRKDISPQRLEHFGFGESNLLNHCSDDVDCSEAEHAINRRVEYFIAPKSN